MKNPDELISWASEPHSRTSKLLSQVVLQHVMFYLVNRLHRLPCQLGEFDPDKHGARNMVSLNSCFSALTFLDPGELLEFHAKADQRLFALYLPGAELTLHASVHGAEGAERQMLFESLSCLGPDDVLILDRGYPAAWLVAYLTEHNIRFCMRCEKSSGGWAAVRAFENSDQVDAMVTLNKPNKWDCEEYGCSGAAPQVRLVKCVTPDGLLRVMATNLPISQVPTAAFDELYHERWRIEEAFKRLKHRCKLESVSGLTQHALMVDVHAKVLADNLVSLVCIGASMVAGLEEKQRTCNRAYAAPCLQRLLPRMVLGLGCLATLLEKAFDLLGGNSHRQVPERKQPRPKNHVKPHPSMAYKR